VLEFSVAGRPDPVTIEPRELVVAGFTATDPDSVRRHIEELIELGVPVPDVTPSFYRLSPGLVTLEPRIEVAGRQTSGEVEPVLVCAGEDWFLTVGSDHTDRDIERTDIERSKAACAKVLSRELVPYDDVAGDWESIRLKAWTGETRTPYQDGLAASLMKVPELLRELEQRCPVELDGLVLFLGTIPLEAPGFVYSDRYALELACPNGGPTIHLAYEVHTNGTPSPGGGSDR
jgi:4-hydroxyphenylacetate 3-monooxygenase